MANPMSEEHLLFLRNRKRTKKMVLITQLLIFILFFTLWEIAADLKWIDPFLFSAPSRMLSACGDMIVDGSLFWHVSVTLWETLVGFFLSTFLGTLIGIFLWWNTFTEKVCNPYLVILNSIPKTALAPIIIVWIGNNMNAVVATAVMTSIIVTILNILTGFKETNKTQIKLIQTLGGSKKQALYKVVLPSSLPIIFSTIKINIGLSFVGVIVGEFLVAKAGLGYLIVYGSQIFKMDWVMLSIILLGVLSALLYQCTVWLERKVARYHR